MPTTPSNIQFLRGATAVLALAALAGCSGTASYAPSSAAPALVALGGESASPQARAELRFVDPAAVKAQISVAAYDTSASTAVQVFNANNKPNKAALCQITSIGEGINALGVDSAGNLWVPQGLGTGGVPVIQEFKPSCGALVTTLSDSNGQPAGIAFSSKGTTYVNNILGPSSSAGNVAVYPKGKKTPSNYLTNANIFLAAGVGVNSKDDVYVPYYSPASTTGLFVFAGGKMPAKNVKNFALGNPGAPTFDKKDNLVITDDSDQTLNVYAPPYTGKPKVFPLKGSSPQCSFNKAQTNLACGDKTNTSVDVYAYPSGKYLYSFNKGLSATVIGVVQSPI
jgi:hypothetical protein